MAKGKQLNRKEVEMIISEMIGKLIGTGKLRVAKDWKDATEQVAPSVASETAYLSQPVGGWSKYETPTATKVTDTTKGTSNSGFKLYKSARSKHKSNANPLYLGISVGHDRFINVYIPLCVSKAVSAKCDRVDLYYNKETNEIGIRFNKDGAYKASMKNGYTSGVVVTLFSFCRDNGIKITKSFRSTARIDGDMIVAKMEDISSREEE